MDSANDAVDYLLMAAGVGLVLFLVAAFCIHFFWKSPAPNEPLH